MTHFFPLAIGALFTGTLLSSCSHSSPTTEARSDAPAVATERTTGTKVDSLNGIPGHHFGDPVSAFPGLELAKSQQPGTQTYTYPNGKPEAGWFGKHKRDGDLFVFYIFKDNRFAGFQALAFGTTRAALQEETLFLLGPGNKGFANTSWKGEKTQASYTPRVLPKGPAEILDIQSLTLVQAQANEASDRMKRENAL